MSGLSAGTAYVSVLPDFSNFGGQLTAGVQNASRQAGAALEGNISASAARANTSLSSIGQGMMMLGGQAGPVGALFTQFGNTVSKGFDAAATGAEAARARIGAVMEGIGLAATGLGVILQSFAGPLEKANADLTTTISNAGQSIDDYSGKIKAADKTQQKFGFTSADTNQALALLVGATGSTDKALGLLNTTTIVAKINHESLAEAAKQLDSGFANNYRWAKFLGEGLAADLSGGLKSAAAATKAADAADQAYGVTLQSLADAQQKLADFEAQVTQKREAAQEAYAANVSAADDKIASAEQHVSDLRQQFADADVAAQQRIVDAETNLDNVRSQAADNMVAAQQRVADAIQAVSDAQAQASDNQAQAEQSVVDAQQRLADLQRSQALVNNPKASAADARQVALRNAQDAVVKAQQKSGEVAEAGTKSVAKAEENVGKAQADVEKVAEADAKSVATAQLAVGKAQADAAKQARTQDEQLLKAQEAVLKAQAELAKIVDKGDGSQLTLAEQQQEANLADNVSKASEKSAAALAKKDQADAAANDNQSRMDRIISESNKRFGNLPRNESQTFAGKIDALLAGIKNFLAVAGEKLVQPLFAVGPSAAILGMLWRMGRKGGGAGGAAGVGESAAGGIGGLSTTVAGEGLGAGAAGLAPGADVGAGFAATGEAAATATPAVSAFGAALAPLAGLAAGVLAVVGSLGVAIHEVFGTGWLKSMAIAAESFNIFSLAATLVATNFHTVWSFVKDDLVPVFEQLWHGVVDAWHFISAAVSGAWGDVIKPIWDTLYGFIRDYLLVEFWLLKTGVDLVWAGIKDTISTEWHLFKPIFQDIVDFINNPLISTFDWLWHHVVEPVFDGIATAIDKAWNGPIKKALQDISDFINGPLTKVFNTIGDVWSGVWNGIKSTISGAVKFIGGLVADFLHVVADVAGAVGAGNVQKVLEQASGDVRSSTSRTGGADTSGLSGTRAAAMAAGGGLGPTPIGPGFVTSRETAIVHEGGPHPEYVIPTDPQYRANARRLYEALGAKLMAGGGQLAADGGSGGGIGGFLSGVGDAISGLASDALGAARQGLAAALSAIPTLSVSDDLLGLLPASVNYARQSLIDAVSGSGSGGAPPAGGPPGPSGPLPPGQVSDWVLAGVRLAGKPDSWANPEVNIAMFESGGDPKSINLWDSNALAGHPSKGLMQTIDGTFQEYAVAGHDDIWNPVDNVAAATGYIASRYGDPWHTPGELSVARGGPYQGYARGGILGAHWAGSMDQGGIVPPGAFVGVNNTGANEDLRPVGDSGGIDLAALAKLIAAEMTAALARNPVQVSLDGKQLSRGLHDRRLAYS